MIYAGDEPELRTVPSNNLYGNVKELTYIIEQYSNLDMPGYANSISILRIDLDLVFPLKQDLEKLNIQLILVSNTSESEILDEYSIPIDQTERFEYPEKKENDLFKMESVSGDFVEYIEFSSKNEILSREMYFYENKKLIRQCNIEYNINYDTKIPNIRSYTTNKYDYGEYCKQEYVVYERGIHKFTQIYDFDEHQNLLSIERFYINNYSQNKSHALIKVEYEYDKHQNWVTARVYQIEDETKIFAALIKRSIVYK